MLEAAGQRTDARFRTDRTDPEPAGADVQG
jgi:hypothetical protein